jgi:hypothetical protein
MEALKERKEDATTVFHGKRTWILPRGCAWIKNIS